MTDREKMINELTFQLHSKEVIEHHDPIQLSVTDANKILKLLKEWKLDCEHAEHDSKGCLGYSGCSQDDEPMKGQEPVEPRLLAAEEVQHLPDKTTICVEQLLSREDEERGYITGKAWGIVCNRTKAPDGGLILSMLGTFFPNTVREIPYKAIYLDENTKKRRTAVYRFWTDRPSDEQSKAVKWDE